MFNDENVGKLDIDALKQAKLEGKKIGLVQGSWDQFHIGHLRYIKIAKENCDYLIVGVDSDAKIQMRKGKNRPLIPEKERYEMIKELGIAKKGYYEPGKSIADDIVIKPVDEKKWELINFRFAISDLGFIRTTLPNVVGFHPSGTFFCKIFGDISI